MTHNRRIALVATIILGILLIPLVAMQFTDQIVWNAFDFLVAGVLLTAIGLVFEFLVRAKLPRGRRIALGLVAALFFLILWAELAVGVFGSPIAGS